MILNVVYIEHGYPIYSCEYCGTVMWHCERIEKKAKNKKPKFTSCCLQGQVNLTFLKYSPELLFALLTNDDEITRHFRENIRA